MSCLLGLAILIGIGPIIISLIMKGISAKQALLVSSLNEPPKLKTEVSKSETELSESEKPDVMLMVSGEIAVVEDSGLTFIILTSSSGKKYILVGPKAEELKSISGKKVTVVGIPRKPIPQEIKGEPIRMTIEVKTAEIK